MHGLGRANFEEARACTPVAQCLSQHNRVGSPNRARGYRLAGSVDTHLPRQVQLYRRQRQVGALYAVTIVHRFRGRCCWPIVGVVAGRGLFMFTRRGGERDRRRRLRRRRRPRSRRVRRRTRRRPPRSRTRRRARAPRRRPTRTSRAAAACPRRWRGARREEDRRDPLLEQGRGRRPQREELGRPAAAPRRQDGRLHGQGREPLPLHAHHRRGERDPDAVAGGREPRGPGRGPERLLRLPDDRPVRAERLAP